VKGKKLKLNTTVKVENESDDLQLRVSHEPPRYTYASKRRSYSSSYSTSSECKRKITKEAVTEQDSFEIISVAANGGKGNECAYCRKEKNSIGNSEDFLSCGSCNAKSKFSHI